MGTIRIDAAPTEEWGDYIKNSLQEALQKLLLFNSDARRLNECLTKQNIRIVFPAEQCCREKEVIDCVEKLSRSIEYICYIVDDWENHSKSH